MPHRKASGLGVMILAAAIAGCAAKAVAGDSCFYQGTKYSDGSAVCQSGTQYRCDDGDWASLATACKNKSASAGDACELAGIRYSSGSASCQAGTQQRCIDGEWKSLGVACTAGDEPIRAVPGTRTCMLNDVTVASNSTVCKAGTTYLCSDGSWVNLGTMCR
jgi:hypothetical protein